MRSLSPHSVALAQMAISAMIGGGGRRRGSEKKERGGEDGEEGEDYGEGDSRARRGGRGGGRGGSPVAAVWRRQLGAEASVDQWPSHAQFTAAESRGCPSSQRLGCWGATEGVSRSADADTRPSDAASVGCARVVYSSVGCKWHCASHLSLGVHPQRSRWRSRQLLRYKEGG